MKTEPIILFAAFLLIVSAMATGEDSFVYRDAAQVLEKFAASRQNMQSFIIQGQTVTDFSSPTVPARIRSGQQHSVFEERSDGTRYKATQLLWGNIDSRGFFVKEQDAHYSSGLWDGEKHYNYARTVPSAVGLVIIADKDSIPANSWDTWTGKKTGYFGRVNGYRLGESERIDELLLEKASRIQLRSQREIVGQTPCYVIHAYVPGRGTHTVWIDPVHDYHIAKMHIQRRPGDTLNNRPLVEGDYSDERWEVAAFEKIKDKWFPQKIILRDKTAAFGNTSTYERVIHITSVDFDPDHEALKSFIPDDIPNGTVVKLLALPPSIEFIWQDGRLIPETEQ